MGLFWKIAVPAACAAAICGTVILWWAHNEKRNERKLVEAASVSRASAERGDAKAQYAFGHMYYHGQGVPQDYAEAVRWYREAADQGDSLAQNHLGQMYAEGRGVPQDYAEAYFWLSLASAQDSHSTTNGEDDRDLAASHLTKTVLLETQAWARKWFAAHQPSSR